MMKYAKGKAYITLIFSILTHLIVNAQEVALRKAYNHYNYYEYSRAIPYFKDAFSQAEAIKEADYIKLANCYGLTNQPEEAASVYLKLIQSTVLEDKTVFLEYGKILLRLGDYEKAKTILKKFLSLHPRNKEVLGYIRACNVSEQLLENRLKIYIENEVFNSTENDFSPYLLNGELLFCSSRILEEKKRYYWDNEAFIDIYKVENKDDKQVLPLPKILNSDMHEGPFVYDVLSQTLYFTRNSPVDKKGGEKKYLLNIFTLKYDNGEWKNLKAFEHNIKGYATGHPAISADGNVIYFVSNRPGSIGETDIYYCRKIDGKWAEPKNLGAKVNTKGRELFPTLLGSSLFFSSDQHTGLGGLDIFSVKAVKGIVSGEPENLGFPFNSKRDDFGLIFKGDDKLSGYFASNRPGGKGGDDIYFFKESKVNIKGVVMDSIQFKNIANVSFRIINEQGNSQDLTTNENGEIALELPTNKRFIFVISKDEYKSKRIDFSTQSLNPTSDTLIFFELDKGISHKLEGVAFDKDGNNPIENAKVTMMDLDANKKEVTRTNREGKFQFFPEKEKNYEIKIDKEGHFVEKVQVFTDTANYQLKPEVPIEKLEVNKILEIENIYYEFDKYAITSKAIETLDEVIAILKDNPTIFIELSSHTDQRGSEDYNKELSKKRANAALAYITSKGIDAYRLTYRFYGKSQLAIECPQGDCDENVHQLNRRTEFKIISY
ncbi:MAG: OmpA family protein [Bacteroidota bacterium]